MSRIAIVAGEISGDRLGAGLIHAVNARHPEIRFAGIAGPLMQAAGAEDVEAGRERGDSLGVVDDVGEPADVERALGELTDEEYRHGDAGEDEDRAPPRRGPEDDREVEAGAARLPPRREVADGRRDAAAEREPDVELEDALADEPRIRADEQRDAEPKAEERDERGEGEHCSEYR